MSSSFNHRRTAVLAAVGATAAGLAFAGSAFASSPPQAGSLQSASAQSGAQRSAPSSAVSVSLAGAFTFHSCPAGTPTADTCLTDHLTGTITGLGAVTGTFEVHIANSKFAADGCGPVDKQGSFTVAGGGTVRLSAHGMFCNSSSIAAYDYQVTGGTGRLAHASGSGQWLVPAPATFADGSGTGAEFFLGSLHS